jgi:colicin import membrane protein
MNPAPQHHLDFAPPPTPGLVRSMTLALLAHLVLLAILAAGVAWKRETPMVAVQAELWAAVPVEAAPLAVEQPTPPPTPEPKPQPEPPPPATPAPPKVETPAPTPPKAVDIVLAKEKERLRKEKELKDAQLAQKEAQRKAQLEQQRKDELAQEKIRLEKERQAKLAKAQQAERDKAQQAAEQAKKDAAAKQAKEQAKRTEEMREQQLKRMAALAGAPPANTGSGGSGNAAKSAGPGSSYFGRVAARIKPNITYTDIISGNPITEIEISLSPSGDIQSRRITKRSGNNAWDNAALNAIDKTEKLPLDNGKVWSPLVIVLSPQTLLGP